MKQVYKDIYGRWSVTTEGDCEGHSVVDLGTHVGYVDDIAFYLADRAYYSLKFKKVEDIDEIRPAWKEVHVHFDIESDTWNNKKETLEEIKEAFIDRPVGVKESNYFASFVLIG